MMTEHTTKPLTEAEFDNLEEGDKVKHVNESTPREVVKVPEPNALAGHVIQVELSQMATLKRPDGESDDWRAVE